MMTNTRIYKFEYNDVCEMCHDSTSKHKILGQRLSQSQEYRPKKKTGITVSIKRCTNCGLIYSYPMPIPNNITDHYGIDPEDYSWDGNYFKYDSQYYSRQIQSAKELIISKTNLTALDVGAGLGKAMKSMLEAGFDTYGIEPSPNFRNRAIEWLKIPTEKIKLSSAEEAKFPENYFDFITFGAVFEHLYHPATVLERAIKWLKPGGIIHIEVPSSKAFVCTLINFYYKLRGTNYVTNLSPMHPPFHLYEYSLKSFTEATKRMELKVVKHYYDVCEIISFPGITKPFLRKYMELTDTGMQLTVYLRK